MPSGIVGLGIDRLRGLAGYKDHPSAVRCTFGLRRAEPVVFVLAGSSWSHSASDFSLAGPRKLDAAPSAYRSKEMQGRYFFHAGFGYTGFVVAMSLGQTSSTFPSMIWVQKLIGSGSPFWLKVIFPQMVLTEFDFSQSRILV